MGTPRGREIVHPVRSSSVNSTNSANSFQIPCAHRMTLENRLRKITVGSFAPSSGIRNIDASSSSPRLSPSSSARKPQADATRDSRHGLGRNSPAVIGRPSTRLQPLTQFRVAMRAESTADLATLKSDLPSLAARVSPIKLREPAESLLRQRAQQWAIYPVTGVPINECGVASTTSTSI